MIVPSMFVGELQKQGTVFFTGVPDSLLKNLCAFINDAFDSEHHIIAANEGNAVALATGHHLASGTIPMVYMQNSGEGNAVNPLLSLADNEVYQIPLLLCIGWRGEPGVHDEPQHVKQGKVTLSLLDTMGIPYQVISADSDQLRVQVENAYSYMRLKSAPYALIVKKGLFEDYTPQHSRQIEGQMSRKEALELVVQHTAINAIYVSTTGMASRELYEIRERNGEGHQKDFLTVGSMGHASQIALGIALNKKERQVVCLDGDGAVLMHLGGMAIIGTKKPGNYVHVILNNGAHDSVGGQPTVGREVDLAGVASCLGYRSSIRVTTQEQLVDALKLNELGPRCIEVLVRKGNQKDLGRPKSTPVENKQAFMQYVTEVDR
ncbi:phosphonopyruvate decarboxylase [Sphaerochaeta globosa]|uniref:Phosphonopyruvate decarboxylase n=1 Tax=Sphaerochaeta globosa (strain ATCC BAA-1886 / DSM 22777 / Buddy) TaxID=158189 RepID=F0RU25_SPHGB|nr:phosphonopyruvate decarboxylase [Sphaerochaeta globosa]ADY12111.1 phosphonopyruvate decarboxylase [Sphaerochaeta globosa str. Buddy]